MAKTHPPYTPEYRRRGELRARESEPNRSPGGRDAPGAGRLPQGILRVARPWAFQSCGPGPGRTGALGAGTAPPLWGCESFGQGIAAHFARLGQTRPGVWGASPAGAAGNDLDNAMAERMRHMLRFGMLEVRVCFSGLQPRFRYPRWGRSVVLELQGLSAACPRRLLYRGQK